MIKQGILGELVVKEYRSTGVQKDRQMLFSI